MFCLRSWLPLLFIPVNSSPLFILTFVTLTYLLHRPCIYCSLLLLILFASSCHWSDRCFFDVQGDWFSPRYHSLSHLNGNGNAATILNANTTTTTTDAAGNATMMSPDAGVAEFVLQAVNETAAALVGAAWEKATGQNTSAMTNGNATAATISAGQQEWTGIGIEWLRSLLGKREWTLPCVNVKVRL